MLLSILSTSRRSLTESMPRSFAASADAPTPMPVHLALLGRLHLLLGAFGVLCGVSLVILAAGTSVALVDLTMGTEDTRAGVWILGICGGLLIAGGLALVVAGRALDRRSRAGRFGRWRWQYPISQVVPFGTALSVYAFWVLLNDDARAEFGRPLRTAGPSRPTLR
jgi:hypothetical protein